MTLDPSGMTHSSVMLRGSPLGSACRCLLLHRTTESTQVHWLGHCCPAEQLTSSMAAPANKARGKSALRRTSSGANASSRHSTVVTAEVGRGHVLQGDLPQEAGALAARIPRHNAAAAKPRPQPRETAIAVEGVGQQVPEGRRKRRVRMLGCVTVPTAE